MVATVFTKALARVWDHCGRQLDQFIQYSHSKTNNCASHVAIIVVSFQLKSIHSVQHNMITISRPSDALNRLRPQNVSTLHLLIESGNVNSSSVYYSIPSIDLAYPASTIIYFSTWLTHLFFYKYSGFHFLVVAKRSIHFTLLSFIKCALSIDAWTREITSFPFEWQANRMKCLLFYHSSLLILLTLRSGFNWFS